VLAFLPRRRGTDKSGTGKTGKSMWRRGTVEVADGRRGDPVLAEPCRAGGLCAHREPTGGVTRIDP